MSGIVKYFSLAGSAIALLSLITPGKADESKVLLRREHFTLNKVQVMVSDTPPPVTLQPDSLHYPFQDNGLEEPVYNGNHPLILNNPSNIKTEVEYDTKKKEYTFQQKIGDLDYRTPTYMTQEEYQDYMFKKQVKSYWKSRIKADDINSPKKSLIPKLTVGGEFFDRIFGGNTVDIRPQGSAELIFGLVINRNENPVLPVRNRRQPNFDFNMKIQLNLIGKIGEKLKVTANYNTEASFDFENQMKLEYNGLEDEILKKIEAGNVSLPLNGTLITGSQSLFGIKTQMQFGKLTATTVFSQQRGKKSEVTVQGGSQTTPFNLNADNYEANRHYFLSQYFRDNYNSWMSTVPVINTPIVITKIEVWVTNRTAQYDQSRNVIGFADLGEDVSKIIPALTNASCANLPIADVQGEFPSNDANTFYSMLVSPTNGLLSSHDYSQASLVLSDAVNHPNTCNAGNKFMEGGRDYELLARARKLQPSEFTLNKRLGFISLNQALNFDEVLCVAFQYTIDNRTYQVGEFSDQFPTGDQALFLKLLKSTQVNTKVAMWDLMMKNVYSIGAYQINPQDFRLDVYRNIKGVDLPYIPHDPIDGRLLVQVMDLDRINANGDRITDGYYDFIPEITINPSNGRIFLPTIEPFGNDLRKKFGANANDPGVNQYIFQELYDSTKIAAQQLSMKNVYKFKGSYKSSSSSEISLNAMNVPQGSVSVTVGGVPLTENVDYTVDYTMGRVKIINESILNSGQPIKVSSENNSLFNMQQKNLYGARFDYKLNKDVNIGGTVLHLIERPITQKVNVGDEPISNTIWGTDFTHRAEAPWLTRFVDKIPFLNTKEPSSIQTAGEFAHLIPGHSKAIGKEGNSYIDDFEGSISIIDLRNQSSWFLSSVPQGQPNLFPEAGLDSLKSGFNRARIAWYTVDQSVFYQQNQNLTPANITKTIQSNHFMREVRETEIFPNKQPPNGQPIILPMLDLAFYPEERGPYNFDTKPSFISSGVDVNNSLSKGDVRLADPASRWGGIMRRLETNDFQSSNIEFVQFWMMDPFNEHYDNTFSGYSKPTDGEMYINLGSVSEDVLRDGKMSFENGMPTHLQTTLPTVQTEWGKIPSISPINNAFNLQESEREYQDVGYDGYNDAGERDYFKGAYISQLEQMNSTLASYADKDPSGDNYHFFRGDDYDSDSKANTLFRYKYFNGMEGNSPTEAQFKNLNSGGYSTVATNMPNSEDINRDNTLSETESYYQYKIKITPQDLNPQNVGNNYITNVYKATVATPDGQTKEVNWYQFKIPIANFENKIGSIEGFNSIRFMRLFLKNFSAPVVCRMARMELVRSDWRRYLYDLNQPGDYLAVDNDQSSFDISAVNFQENGSRTPVNYVIPPGINQQQNVQTTNLVLLNEQALVLRTCGLTDGHSKAVYKNIDMDVRSYKKAKMFVHAEKLGNNPINDGDLRLFLRLGTDFNSNYYEYELPLKLTTPGLYDANSDDDRLAVWPKENEIDIDFEELTSLKLKRPVGSIEPLEYVTADGRIMRVVGNPSISALKNVMVGIKNPKDPGNESKCIEVWINELRLTDFNQHGGWAANGRVTAKLADFGQVALSGSVMTPFFGSIEKKVSERSRETTKQYDASTTLQFGKFLPEDWKINLPVYVGQSETFITPQYDPSNPDILMSNVNTNSGFSNEEIRSIKQRAQDYTRRRGFNLTNVSKGKGKGATKSYPWDIENISLTYAYTEQFKRSVTVDHNIQKSYKGALAYVYQTSPKNIKPFGKSGAAWLNNKWFALIKEINFTPIPSRFGFNTDISRTYNEVLNRDITNIIAVDTKTQTQYNKTFNTTRSYDLKWELTKNLKLDFAANNEGRILEPAGAIDSTWKRDQIKENIKSLGVNTNYRQSLNVNYSIPINKIPIFDFTTASYSYKSNYTWTRRLFASDSIGNTIQNGNTQSWNAQFNFTTLYNKIPFLKKINSKTGKSALPTMTKDGKVSNSETKPTKDPNDTTKKKSTPVILEHIARVIMTLKQAQFTYSLNAGTTLPGYADSTSMLGMNTGNSMYAPGLGFVFGSQSGILSNAEQNHWIVKRKNIPNPYAHTVTKTINGTAKLEPFRDFRIDLSFNRTQGENNGMFLGYDPQTDKYQRNTVTKSGNFSISTITINSAFSTDAKGTNENEVFNKFRELRGVYRQQLWEKNPYSRKDSLFDGYNSVQQDVLIFSFIDAYTNNGKGKHKMELFPKIPLPNWTLTYDGLGKLELMKKYFKSVTLRHGYKSTFNISSFNNNVLFYDPQHSGYSQTRVNGKDSSNFISEYQIGTVTISESFSPLLKIDLSFIDKGIIKGLSANVEVKRDRNISLIASGPQVTETKGNELIVGAGYRYPQFEIPRFKIKGKPIKSDLNFKLDLSLRKNTTVLRRVIDNDSRVTQGQNVVTIKTAIDYVISNNVNIRIFFDKIINTPVISSSFPTSTTNTGVSLRFNLGQ